MTTQSTDLWSCLQKVHVILCPSVANNALKVGGGGLGGCFLSRFVDRVIAIELHLARASTYALNPLSNFQFPVSNSLIIINLSSWGTLLRRTGTSKLPYCQAYTQSLQASDMDFCFVIYRKDSCISRT